MSDLTQARWEPVTLFVVMQNTDLTEGRGYDLPIAWSLSRGCAERLARKKGVMGSDAPVSEVPGFKIGNRVYGPIELSHPSSDDLKADQLRGKREGALKRVREAGVSDDDLRLLGVKP